VSLNDFFPAKWLHSGNTDEEVSVISFHVFYASLKKSAGKL
jgi:hypothetical protein